VRSRSHFTPYYFLVAGVLLQGLSPVLTKLLLGNLSYATVVASRYLLAAAFLFPFGYRHEVNEALAGKPRRRDWIALFLVGALGSGFGALLFTAAIDHSHAGIANAISKTAPIFVAFFAYFTLRERITWARFSLVLMMVAAAVLIGAGELSFGMATARQHLIGDAMALGAGILRAVAEILGKGALRRFRPSTVAMWRFGVGFLITGVISVGGGQYMGVLNLDTGGWTILLMLAGVSTSLSMFLYYRGLAEIPAHVAVTLKLVGAIVTVVVSWIVLNEALNAYHIAGIAVLVFGAYLIVMRTARQQVADIAVQAAPAAATCTTRPWAASLKNKIALLVAASIAITMMSGTYLAIRHTNNVINEQVRFAMGETAYMMLQYQTLGRQPDAGNYQQLVRRLVHHKMQGRVYSVEILYVMLLDEHGRIIAYAADPAISELTAEGRRASPNYDTLGLQLLEQISAPDFKAKQDVVPLTAELEGYSQVMKMGCRKSIARRTASEITVRYFSLAVLLIILGILVTTYLVGHLTRPLERLSAAAERIAAGDLSVPLVTRGDDEVHDLSDAMAAMVAELQTAAVLRRGILGAAGNGTADESVSGRRAPPVVLVISLPSESSEPANTEQLSALLNAWVVAICEHEGEIHEHGQGRIVVGWGTTEPERDDLLRAVLAGLDICARSNELCGDTGTLGCPRLLVDYMPTGTAADVVHQLAEHVADGRQSLLYLTGRAYMEVSAYVDAKPIAGGDFYMVNGLREDEAMRQIARSPDE